VRECHLPRPITFNNPQDNWRKGDTKKGSNTDERTKLGIDTPDQRCSAPSVAACALDLQCHGNRGAFRDQGMIGVYYLSAL